jgi:hypothetical protein
MTLYSFLLFIHVATAVGGLGQIGAIGQLTRDPSTVNPASLKLLLRAASGSLGIMLLSGIGLTWMVNWSFAQSWWFRLSMILFLLLGFLLGMGQRELRAALAEPVPNASPALKSLHRLAIGMSLTLAALVFLMEVKPF